MLSEFQKYRSCPQPDTRELFKPAGPVPRQARGGTVLGRDQSRRKEAKDFFHLNLTCSEIRWMEWSRVEWSGVSRKKKGWVGGWMDG